jgi:hypothetical protein
MGAEFRVGQEVEVTVRARVAQVFPGPAGGSEAMVRLEVEEPNPPLGWVDPNRVTVAVIRQPLPTEPGLYAIQKVQDASVLVSHDALWETDGYEFYYLNQHGRWCDIGWGDPGTDVGALLVRWMPLPF